jgi:O-antigen ligase
MFLGTIGTEKGFHFPDQTLRFYLLPLVFCFFRLSKKSLLQIAEVFFKMGIIFSAITILYWFYNFLHLDAGFVEWITKKTGYIAQMTAWESQAEAQHYWWENTLTKDSLTYYSAYFFVSSWSYLHHPTTNSIILLVGLITGFYLYHKKNEFPTISKWDLLLYIVLCLLVIMLLQSRIGVVGFLLIAGITGLYYLRLKIRHFKIGLAIYILLAGASLVILNDKISDFANDDARDAYRRIAVSYIQEHFWWGSGFDEQQLVLERQAEKMKDVLPPSVYPHINSPITHVHNQFLGSIVQYGILGLIVLLAMLTAIAYYAVKNRSYLLQTFLCFIFLFMLIEEGEFLIILTFILFFTAISEAKN